MKIYFLMAARTLGSPSSIADSSCHPAPPMCQLLFGLTSPATERGSFLCSSSLLTKQNHDWEILIPNTMKSKGCSIHRSWSIWKMCFVLFSLPFFFHCVQISDFLTHPKDQKVPCSGSQFMNISDLRSWDERQI